MTCFALLITVVILSSPWRCTHVIRPKHVKWSSGTVSSDFSALEHYNKLLFLSKNFSGDSWKIILELIKLNKNALTKNNFTGSGH